MNLTQTTLPERRITDYGPRTTPARQFTIYDLRFTICNSAFTLVEILVTVALLSIIILGLYAMFHQTQRAFQSSMTQTDVLEAGRAVTDMLAREAEQVAPVETTNAYTFATQIIKDVPLPQPLPGGSPATVWRTNYLQDVFLLTRSNQMWIGIGYCVRTNDANGHLWFPETGPNSGQAGVGSLYRWMQTTNVMQNTALNNGLPSNPVWLFVNFQTACQNGSTLISNRICDGVVHFSCQAFATNNFTIFGNGGTNACFRTNALTAGYSIIKPAATHAVLTYPGQMDACWFWSNAVPAYLEFELGVLESRQLTRYNSMSDAGARLSYLQRPEISPLVHLFRQRVPVRNVDPLAYQ